MACNVALYGTWSRKTFPQNTFLNVKIMQNYILPETSSLPCLVLLFSNIINIFSLLLLCHYCMYLLHFLQLVTLNPTAMSAAKKSKSDERQFQEPWTVDFGFVCRNHRAVCTLVQYTLL